MNRDQIFYILASKPHNPHYLNRYFTYIQICNKFNNDRTDILLDEHHICPKAKFLFPEYESFSENPWNKVLLTPKQHLIAHRTLAKVYGKGMKYTYIKMSGYKKYNRHLTPEEYQLVREELSKFISERQTGEGNPFYGKTHSTEHIEKCKTRKWSQEVKDKIALGNSKPCSEEKKLKISNTLKGRKIPEQLGSGNPMTKLFKLTSPTDEEFLITSSDFEEFCEYKNLLPYTLKLNKNKGKVPELNKYSNKSIQKLNTVGWEFKILGRLKEFEDVKLFSIP